MTLSFWYIVLFVAIAAAIMHLDADLHIFLSPNAVEADFNNQVVWVTGASSGLGAEMAVQLNDLGAQVVMSARRLDKLEKVADLCRGKYAPLLIPLDVTDYDATTAAYEEVMSKFGHVDTAVLNAGRSQRMAAVDMPFDETKALMETNFLSAVFLTKLVLPDMIKRNSGKIVAVSSLSGKIGTPGGSSYSATKYAMHGYFDALRSELGATDVKVSLVLPGPVDSDVVSAAVRPEGRDIPDEGKKMTTPRFVNLFLRGLARDVDEMWISTQPFLLLTYMAQYMPWLSRQIGRVVGPSRVKAIDEDGNPFDLKKLLGIN
mmetsp:Transcript_25718/g.43328  ORF Transcript_25718/g.43328 Transcript_25718/m.43328 type:complete len:317 (+) Transcript_25718:58-1008(+)